MRFSLSAYLNAMERDIERYFVKHIEVLGGRAYKFSSPNHRGVYDRVVVLPGGDVWFVELKAPKGRLSKLQEKFRDDMTALGAQNVLLCSKDAVDNFIFMLGVTK